jgi:hypothetical protein
MPGIVIEKITKQALRQGYSRGEDLALEFPAAIEEDAEDGILLDMTDIDERFVELIEETREQAITADILAPSTGLSDPAKIQGSAPVAPLLVSEPCDVPINTFISFAPTTQGQLSFRQPAIHLLWISPPLVKDSVGLTLISVSPIAESDGPSVYPLVLRPRLC